jgi:predicted anti-sigma-YlaC factor YlaD
MRCRKALRLASRAIDRTVSGSEAASLGAHLARCEACRLAAEGLSQAWGALAPLEQVDPAPDDWAQIEARIEARSRRWTPPWEGWQLVAPRPATALALAGIVALGAAGGGLLSRAALGPARGLSFEATAFAETLGDLPWDSPAAGLARPMLAALPSQEAR